MKKGQATVYIIVGIVILLVLALVAVLSSIKLQESLGLRKTAEWTAPVKAEIESCVGSLATEAIIKLGEHGGYIDMNDAELSGRAFSFNRDNPTESDGISITKSSFQPIPYWWYMNAPNNCDACTVSSLLPGVQQMEAQVSLYIERGLETCTGNLTSFGGQAMKIRELEKPEVTTTFGDSDIDILMEYPLELSLNNEKSTISSYNVHMEFNLRKYFVLGLQILKHEANEQFLEKIMYNLINVNSGKSFNKLPPIYDMDFGNYIVTWNLDYVKFLLENNVMPYFDILQIAKTKGAKELVVPDSPYAQTAFSTMYLDFLNQSYGDTKVQFSYLGWPVYLKIHPIEGKTIKPSVSVKKFFMNLAPPSRINEYESFYSTSFPVMVRITGEKAIRGKDFNLNFALEGNIRSNRNLLEWFQGNGTIGIWDYGLGEAQRPVDEPPSPFPAKKLFCDENQRLSGEITVKAWDAKTKGPLVRAKVNYGCGTYQTCELGETILNENNEAVFTGKMPLCQGGFISVEKEGYHAELRQFTTKMDVPGEAVLTLEPYREFNISVKKYQMQPQNNIVGQSQIGPLVNHSPYCCGSADKLGKDEKVLLNIEKIKESTNTIEGPLVQSVVMDNEGIASIKLIPGSYRIKETFTSSDTYLIRQGCNAIRGQQIPSKDEKMVVFGGATINETNGPWRLTAKDLDAGKSGIEFYTLVAARAECIDSSCILNPITYTPRCIGIDEISKLESYSMAYASYIMPKFK